MSATITVVPYSGKVTVEVHATTPSAVRLQAIGVPGASGRSAYQVAVANGFSGTEAEWLTSLAAVADGVVIADVPGLQAALDAPAAAIAAHAGRTDNPHGVTKAQVGLGNADNTADADKPVSTAVQTALDGKAAAGHTHNTAGLADKAVTYAKMQDVSATARMLGRKTAGAGAPEEMTLSDVLDLVGPAAQGDILYRGASGWARLAAGTSGYYLKTLGAGADPAWATVSGSSAYTAYPSELLPFGITDVHATQGQVGATATTALTSDRLYVFPMTFGKISTLTSFGVKVTNAVAGSNVRYGLYDDAGGKPGTLVFDAGNFDTGTTGNKFTTLSQAVTPGARYWAAVIGSGAPAIVHKTGGTTSIGLNAGSGSATSQMVGYVYRAKTASAPPAALDGSESGASWTIASGLSAPAIYWKGTE